MTFEPMKGICFRIGVALTLLTQTGIIAARPNAHGALLWQQDLNGTRADRNDRVESVAADNHVNVVAAGETVMNIGRAVDFTVVKFDRDGTLLWQQTLNGTAANSFDDATSVAVDNQGNVVAAGSIENAGTSRDFTVAKFGR